MDLLATLTSAPVSRSRENAPAGEPSAKSGSRGAENGEQGESVSFPTMLQQSRPESEKPRGKGQFTQPDAIKGEQATDLTDQVEIKDSKPTPGLMTLPVALVLGQGSSNVVAAEIAVKTAPTSLMPEAVVVAKPEATAVPVPTPSTAMPAVGPIVPAPDQPAETPKAAAATGAPAMPIKDEIAATPTGIRPSAPGGMPTQATASPATAITAAEPAKTTLPTQGAVQLEQLAQTKLAEAQVKTTEPVGVAPAEVQSQPAPDVPIRPQVRTSEPSGPSRPIAPDSSTVVEAKTIENTIATVEPIAEPIADPVAAEPPAPAAHAAVATNSAAAKPVVAEKLPDLASSPAASQTTASTTTMVTDTAESRAGAVHIEETSAPEIRQQVVRGLASRLDPAGNTQKLVIRLNPEALGQVDVEFTTRGNQLSVLITASGAEAEQALREGVRELTDAIQDKAVRFQGVDVKIEQREGQDSRQENRNDARQDGQRGKSNQQGGRRQRGRQQEHTNHTQSWAEAQQEG